jgi:DNA helicase-4
VIIPSNIISLIVIGICFVAVVVIAAIMMRRTRLKKAVKELTERIPGIPSFEHAFVGEVISSSQEKRFICHYADIFAEASSLNKKLSTFIIKPPEAITKFIYDFEAIPHLVKDHNKEVIRYLLETHKDFFDHCLPYPLDTQQRSSIVSEEDNCLVVSSAGSGKTSSIIGKVKYLTEIKRIDPARILLISYTNKAAAELTERLATPGLRGYTFHKLAIDLVGQVSGIKPSICDNTDALTVEIFRKLLEQSRFKKSVVEYFSDYQVQEDDWDRRKNERREQLSEQKKVQLKALLPDMDGKTIRVRSEQEQKICFALSSLGITFRYEEQYEHPLADAMHSQYKPDFSIYFEQEGKQRRVYLEHFGVNEHGLVPVWFAKDRGITYEEANQQYNDGIVWKNAAHKKFGTKLLTTSSADFYQSDIKDVLKVLLEKSGVPIHEKTDAELYDLVLPKGSKQEKAFIRLVATFITLAKSSCKSIQEVLQQASMENDKRSVFIIKNIFQPVYERYADALKVNGQIDFTDAILQATEFCRSAHSVEYDYIIVDEFQDISVDRYHFLSVLREGNPPAKLYCVGDDWQSIYRFSGSDMALFNQFSKYFGATEITKIETTYRFGEPLVALSSQFIQRNNAQIKKSINPFRTDAKTDLEFYAYDQAAYCDTIGRIIAQIPPDKSIFLLGRYSFDDYYLSFMYKSIKKGNQFFYIIGNREIEFLTVHKSKGLEANYVILLQCNKDTYGFPSLVSDDPVLNYVLTASDQFPYGEERRLFYVAITRAKIKTIVLYDRRFPSVFVDEFLQPEKVTDESYVQHRNSGKRWTHNADQFLLKLHHEGKSVKYIAQKMGRSQTSIVMRLGKLNS